MSEYETDVVAWSERQGELLRRIARGERVNDGDMDWLNIAEEIDSVGRSERAALASHIGTILEHLIKLQISPATAPRAGWRDTILRARGAAEELLEDSPSLRHYVDALIARRLPLAHRLALSSLAAHGETPQIDVTALQYEQSQVLGDWWPDTA